MHNKQQQQKNAFLHCFLMAALLQVQPSIQVHNVHHTRIEQPWTLPMPPLPAGTLRCISSMQLSTDAVNTFKSNTFCFVFVVSGQQKPCVRYSKPTSRTKFSAQTLKAQRMRISFLIPVYRCGLIWQSQDKRLCCIRMKIHWKEILRYLEHRLNTHSLLLSNTFEKRWLFLNQAAE